MKQFRKSTKRPQQVDLDESGEASKAVASIQPYLTTRTDEEVAEDLYLSPSDGEEEEKEERPETSKAKAAEELEEEEEGEMVEVEGDEPVPVGSSSPKPQSPPKAGIWKQSAVWTNDIQSTHESQRFHYQKLKEREQCLTNSNKRLQAENNALQAKVTRIAEFKSRIRELEGIESRFNRADVEKKSLEKEVEKEKQEKAKLAEENADLKLKIKQMEAAKVVETRRTTIHVPVYRNRIVDDCLMNNEDLNTTTECYGTRPDFSCLHLSLVHGGPIYKLVHHRTTYRTPSKYITPIDCNFIILIPLHLFQKFSCRRLHQPLRGASHLLLNLPALIRLQPLSHPPSDTARTAKVSL